MLHSESRLSSAESATRLAVILILLIESISFEKLVNAVEEVDWSGLRGILLKSWTSSVVIYILYYIVIEMLTRLRSRNASSILVMLLHELQII